MKMLQMAAIALVGIGAILLGFGMLVSFIILVNLSQYVDCIRQFPAGIGSKGFTDFEPPIICSESIPPAEVFVLGIIIPLASGFALAIFGLKKYKVNTLT